MTARAWAVEGGKPYVITREEARAALDDTHFVWVHFDDCDATTEAWLKGPGGLAEFTVNALLATETRPRLEPLDGGALVNLRGPDAAVESNSDLLSSIRLWAARGRVFSVTRRDLAALDPVEATMRAGRIVDPGDFVATLAAEITAELDPDVAALGDTLDECEEDVGARGVLPMRRRIAHVRAKAIAYRRFVAPQRAALQDLATLNVGWLDDADRMQLRDAADRAARMTEELEAIRERAALLHEQLTDLRAETIDTRSLVISVVAMIFLPLTFLTGLLGMNVDGIPYAHTPWAFWGVCAVCAAIAIAVGWYFIRAHWFR